MSLSYYNNYDEYRKIRIQMYTQHFKKTYENPVNELESQFSMKTNFPVINEKFKELLDHLNTLKQATMKYVEHLNEHEKVFFNNETNLHQKLNFENYITTWKSSEKTIHSMEVTIEYLKGEYYKTWDEFKKLMQ